MLFILQENAAAAAAGDGSVAAAVPVATQVC